MLPDVPASLEIDSRVCARFVTTVDVFRSDRLVRTMQGAADGEIYNKIQKMDKVHRNRQTTAGCNTRLPATTRTPPSTKSVNRSGSRRQVSCSQRLKLFREGFLWIVAGPETSRL